MCRTERAIAPEMMGHVAFAHKMLAVNSILAYLRLLDRFSLSSALGPVLIMIRKMAGDVMALLSILFVFLVGFGLTFMVLLRPVDAPAVTISELLSSSGIL